MKIGQNGADESAKAPTWARGIMDQSWFYDKAGSTPGTIESEMDDRWRWNFQRMEIELKWDFSRR